MISFVTVLQATQLDLLPTGEQVLMFREEDCSRDAQKQLKDLLRLVNKELGSAPQADPSLTGFRIFVMVHSADGHVLGCLVGQLLTEAYRSPRGALASLDEMVLDRTCQAGVNRIWVREVDRRTGVAVRLLDGMRANMIFNYILDKDKIAFSQPTYAGQRLAETYCGRSDILVYRGRHQLAAN